MLVIVIGTRFIFVYKDFTVTGCLALSTDEILIVGTENGNEAASALYNVRTNQWQELPGLKNFIKTLKHFLILESLVVSQKMFYLTKWASFLMLYLSKFHNEIIFCQIRHMGEVAQAWWLLAVEFLPLMDMTKIWSKNFTPKSKLGVQVIKVT